MKIHLIFKGIGENLTDDQIEKICELDCSFNWESPYFPSKGDFITLHSTGSFLNEDTIDELFDLGIFGDLTKEDYLIEKITWMFNTENREIMAQFEIS